jgi:osmotically-inducible protein OsmY
MKRLASILILSLPLSGFSTIGWAQTGSSAPDNSAVNARDRNPEAITAGEQSNSKSDMELTRKIRRAVVKNDSLSMMAHNVKIVCVNGSVTLRGPVKTDEEKTTVADIARNIAGPDKVDDQLEVKNQ